MFVAIVKLSSPATGGEAKTGRVDSSNVRAARRHMATLQRGEDGDSIGLREMNNLSKILFWFVALHSSPSFHSPSSAPNTSFDKLYRRLNVICCRPTSPVPLTVLDDINNL